ncbi:MAG: PilZ domain-containing protein [Gudongella sp.]|jgi:c-di-GMP-binding flagellar brake protein YcgR|nr:PilZ domain-containing protein [Gudongella sp.]
MEKFELNSKVELINTDGHGMQGMLYDTDTGTIVVSVTPTDSDFRIFRPGESLEVVIYDVNNLVSFQGVITTRESGDFMLYRIQPTSEMKKFQRREYVRVPYSGIFSYSTDEIMLQRSIERIEEQYIVEGKLGGFSFGRAVDLSGGGVRFRTTEKLRIGQDLTIMLKLDSDVIITRGQIRHGYTDTVEGRMQYFYGFMFKENTEEKTDKIIKHVFLLMRKARPV